jgi:hypothetical protein
LDSGKRIAIDSPKSSWVDMIHDLIQNPQPGYAKCNLTGIAISENHIGLWARNKISFIYYSKSNSLDSSDEDGEVKTTKI